MASLFVLLSAFENLGGIFFFNRRKDRTVEEETEEERDNLLCKFVKDGSGRKIGESVSVDEDILIIKSKERFLGVPLKHVEDEGKTLLVKGLVDLDKAYEMGERWRKNSFHTVEEIEEAEGEKDGF
jgi:hypothetical protein